MPYKDKAAKAANQKAHREKNRAKYCEDERKRNEAMTAEERASLLQKKREYGQVYRAAGLVDKEKNRAYARKVHELKKQDPEYRRAATLRMKAWAEKNRDRFNATHRAIRARKMATNLGYRLTRRLRNRFYMAVKNKARSGLAVRELGCSIEELRTHLEGRFVAGMSWDNWSKSGWHIDHIKPLASFDLTDPEQARQACHYTNLQPLWAQENLRKHSKPQHMECVL